MYNLIGTGLLTESRFQDNLREAERLHQVSALLRERKALQEVRRAERRGWLRRAHIGGLAILR